jgi:hypothetical protein
MKYESETLKGLKKSCGKSKRDGKWSTVSETRDYSKDIPMGIKIKPILIQLVKESRAEKKKGFELYRPTGGGWGGFGTDEPTTFKDLRGERSQEDSGRDKGKDASRDDGSMPSRWSGDDPIEKGRVAPGDMVKTGVGIMIGGGIIGGTSAPSVGNISRIAM